MYNFIVKQVTQLDKCQIRSVANLAALGCVRF